MSACFGGASGWFAINDDLRPERTREIGVRKGAGPPRDREILCSSWSKRQTLTLGVHYRHGGPAGSCRWSSPRLRLCRLYVPIGSVVPRPSAWRHSPPGCSYLPARKTRGSIRSRRSGTNKCPSSRPSASPCRPSGRKKLKSAFLDHRRVIGVMFLIAVVSVVQGMNRYMTDKFRRHDLGVNTFRAAVSATCSSANVTRLDVAGVAPTAAG